MGLLTSVQLAAIKLKFETSALTGDPVTFSNFEVKVEPTLLNPLLTEYTLYELIDIIGGDGGPSGPDDEIYYQRFLAAYNSLP